MVCQKLDHSYEAQAPSVAFVIIKNMQNSPMSESDVAAAVFDVNMRSAKAKEINIFELGNLNDFLPHDKAEQLRKEFVAYKTPIKQITNLRKFTSWTDNTEFVQQNLAVKYVSPENMLIQNEILIFEDTVAIYRLTPTPLYKEINDASYAQMMRQLFQNTWETGDFMPLSKYGSTLTKQYLPLSINCSTIPVVIYPAKDDGEIEEAFPRTKPGQIEAYVTAIINSDPDYFKDADAVLAYVWNQEATPCCDIWKVMRNEISDDSGFLYDARVYEGQEITKDLGVASGNSSIVLAAEELLLRELIISEGHSFSEAADRTQYKARFPIGYAPEEAYYFAN